MKTSEAQKRASKKYYLKHKEYYSKKANENTIKMRKERNEYKQRIVNAIEYIKTQQVIFANYDIVIEEQLDILLNILQGKDNE